MRHPGTYGGRLGPPPGAPPGELAADPNPPEGTPHGKAPLLWAYAADGSPVRKDSPELSIPLAHIAGADVVAVPAKGFTADVAVATRTGWSGPCAIVVLEGSTAVGWIGAILPASPIWIAPILTSALGMLIAAGSVVERIRRLTMQVRAVAATGYRQPVAVPGNDEVGELARAFDAAGAALQRQIAETASRETALREFLANTTHDVMLPLTVLQGHLAMLRSQGAGADPKVLGAAMDEAHYLGALVHNLAAVAQLDTTEREAVRLSVDLCAVVERVAARHRTIARERGVSLHYATPDSPILTSADVTLIEQAVNNLVDNALRYHHPDGNVAMVLDATEASFVLRVFDDGPGVAEDRLARLSERGFRADDARTRAPGGKGLGLHIVQRVVDSHGFTLVFSRSVHGGLEATISGPKAPGR